MGIRDYLGELTRSGTFRQAIRRAFRQRRGGSKVRVLVAVDDAASRGDVVAILGRRAYAVTVASGSEHAIELCRSREFDVALVDARPTLHDETDLLAVLRRNWPDLATIAVIPSVGASATRHEAVAGAVLESPIDGATLLDTVERALGAE